MRKRANARDVIRSVRPCTVQGPVLESEAHLVVRSKASRGICNARHQRAIARVAGRLRWTDRVAWVSEMVRRLSSAAAAIETPPTPYFRSAREQSLRMSEGCRGALDSRRPSEQVNWHENCRYHRASILGQSRNNRCGLLRRVTRSFGEPQETEKGTADFRSVREVPVRPDKITVYLPPSLVPQVLRRSPARGCDELLGLILETESEQVWRKRSSWAERDSACSILGWGFPG